MTSTDAAQPVGLLAGSGRFPIAFAEKAREVGLPVVCVGLSGIAATELKPLVGRFHWAGPLRVGRMIRLFKREGVQRLVMAGKVPKADLMHNPWKLVSLLPDLRTLRMYYFGGRRDNRDDALLLTVVDEFAGEGLTFESALTLCPELLVRPGVLTRRAPTAGEDADIAFGWTLAREMGRLDVGQSVVVKDRAVLSIEAIEGTDKAILRAVNCAAPADLPSSKSQSRSRTCVSTCRRSAATPSKHCTARAGASWPSRRIRRFSWTKGKPSPWRIATA